MRSHQLPKNLLLALALVPTAISTLTGCASYYLPSTRMESPEVLGRGTAGKFEAVGFMGGNWLLAESEAQFDKDGKRLPKDILPGAIPPNFFTGFSLPLSDRTDASIRLSSHLPPLLGIKHQLLGEPLSNADAGNFSLSLSGAAGYLLGQASSSYLLAEAAIPTGYRWRKGHLLSLTPGVRFASLSGNQLPRTGTAFDYGLAMGYQFETESLIWRIEPCWSQGSFSDVQTGHWSGAASLSFRILPPP